MKITKNQQKNFFFILSGMLAVAFVIRTAVDYINYSPANSAPFSVYILVRALEFLIPAAVCLIVGIVLKRKKRNK